MIGYVAQWLEQPQLFCKNPGLVEAMLPILPPLDTMRLGHPSKTGAQFAGGISTDGETFQRQVTVNLVDEVEVRGRIAAAPPQLNQLVDWVLYATYWPIETAPPIGYRLMDGTLSVNQLPLAVMISE